MGGGGALLGVVGLVALLGVLGVWVFWVFGCFGCLGLVGLFRTITTTVFELLGVRPASPRLGLYNIILMKRGGGPKHPKHPKAYLSSVGASALYRAPRPKRDDTTKSKRATICPLKVSSYF